MYKNLAVFALILSSPTAIFAQDGAELRLMKRVFETAQTLSFKNNREYCGYLVLDENNRLNHTKLTKGREESCLADDFPEEWTPIASYHTHGAHVDGESFELPSYEDVEGDEEEGVDGYIATPGGRLWYSDSTERTVNLICVGCVPADPRFEEHPDDAPYDFYTYDELREGELE